MKTAGIALRLTVLIGEDDTWGTRSLSHEIVCRAREAGLDGASVFRGTEGFGASRLIHTARILSHADGLPTAIVIVDFENKVRDFLPQLDEIIHEGSVIVEECEMYRYTDPIRRQLERLTKPMALKRDTI